MAQGPASIGQILFNRADQVGNTDRFGKKWMPLDAKASLCLSFCDQGSEKDDRRSPQFWIGLDLCRYFAPVHPWHHYVQQNQVRLKILGALMSLSRVVFLSNEIGTSPLRSQLGRAGKITAVIDY
jgi:hypothetical protein